MRLDATSLIQCDDRSVARIRESVDIDALSERVWAVVAEDVTNAPKWTSNLDKVEKLEVEQTVYAKPKKCSGKFIQGPLKGTWSYAYTQHKDGSTRLVYEMDYELTGLLRFAGSWLGSQYAAGIRTNMQSLKNYIESGRGPKAKK